jgi:group I intron endonuclease
MNGLIYYALFPNGKGYVGQTRYNLERRKAEHKRYSLRDRSKNSPLHRAIKKYGLDVIQWSILESGISDINILNERETFWIKEKDTIIDHDKGYNCRSVGEGHIISEEMRKRMISPATRPEVRAKMSKTRRERGTAKGKNNPMYGVRLFGKDNHNYGKHHKFSDEARKNMSEAHKGKKPTFLAKIKMSKSAKKRIRNKQGQFI